VTYEQQAFGAAIPTTDAHSAWHGDSADYGYGGYQGSPPSGFDDGSHWYGTHVVPDERGVGVQAARHAPQAEGGYATAVWETQVACGGAATDHGDTTWWSGTPETYSESHDAWNIPASTSEPASETPWRTEPDIDGTAACEPEPEDSRSATPRSSVPPPRRSGPRGRRAPARRSAWLTVAAPSMAVLGMAGFAGASVGLGGKGEETSQADIEADPATESAATDTLDAQLSEVAGDARGFAGRASRAQGRVDLEQRRLEEQKRRQEEAARKRAEAARREALRPKFALPVAQHGVGELFGAIGSMWANRHTGLDFPVPMNTPVMAVTDGTVQTKWNQFYGNTVIVTAPDGTETWYCHLAGFRIRTGHVKAGEAIAYAGSTGNSSGPHLHLEVHPGGGAAVDPLQWLRNHGLDPT